jgi:Concanavalin A-like lectin/glucanases superfamily
MDTALALNQWSYLTVVFTGSQVQFSVNGTLVTTKSLGATVTARGNTLRMGADASPDQYFKGLLDDVRLYNRTLTSTEIQTDMNTGV